MKKFVFYALAFLSLGAVLVYSLVSPNFSSDPNIAPRQSNLSTRGISSVEPISPRVAQSSSVYFESSAAYAARPLSQNSVYQIFMSKNGLSDAYRQLDAMPSSGEARYYKALVAQHCINYIPEIAKNQEQRIYDESTGALQAQRLLALAQNIKSCNGMPYRDNPNILMTEAANAGNLQAMAFQVGGKEPGSRPEFAQLAQQAQALASLKDPVVIDGLASYFSQRESYRTWKLPNIDGEATGVDIGHAMALAACDLGQDCSANSYIQQSACIRNAHCGLDRAAEYQQSYYSPEGFVQVNAIREQIVASVRSGIWPNNFWVGLPKRK